MRRPWLALLLSVLAVSQLAYVACEDVEDEDYADAERALLVVRKSVKDISVVQGRNLTVAVSIYNAGASSALNVEVEDAALPSTVQLVAGSLSAKFERVPIGTNVTHEYVVVATSAQGTVILPPATVKYQAEMESEDYQVGKSPIAGFYVLTPSEQIKKDALTWGAYASLGLCKTGGDWRNLFIFVVLVGILLGGNWTYKQMTKKKQDWNRQKHLKDFGLDSEDEASKKGSRKARRQTAEDKES